MQIEAYRDFCLSLPGVTESIPFSKLPNVLVFKVAGKMFTATDLETFDGFSIKCVPETIDALKAEYPSLRDPSYFSKKHWCNVVMDGQVPDDTLFSWLKISYSLVVANLPKKVQRELGHLSE